MQTDYPYGEARSITGTATLNLRASGQYFLAESGLMYNWHRHYDPSLGRYTQPDPIADVLATQPVNLDGSSLIAEGGVTGGSQLAPSAASPPNIGSRIGAGPLTDELRVPNRRSVAKHIAGVKFP